MTTITAVAAKVIRIVRKDWNPSVWANCPKPPAPIAPAMAVYPINEIAVTVIPEAKAGKLFGDQNFIKRSAIWLRPSHQPLRSRPHQLHGRLIQLAEHKMELLK